MQNQIAHKYHDTSEMPHQKRITITMDYRKITYDLSLFGSVDRSSTCELKVPGFDSR